MRSNQSSNRNASNAKNASRSARIGCICGPARHVESRSVATARQTIMRANTCTRAGIRSSRLRSPVSAGCTVILTMPSLSIKLWRFVYRSCRLKRFHKCCSHRFATGRIRPVCGPVAGPPRRSSFTLGRRPTGPWLQRLFSVIANIECRVSFCFRLRMLFDKFSNPRRRHRPGLTRHFHAVLEQHHGWDRIDTKTSGQAGNLFGVYLCQNELTGCFLRHFPELRRNHFAWAAPRRPEID